MAQKLAFSAGTRHFVCAAVCSTEVSPTTIFCQTVILENQYLTSNCSQWLQCWSVYSEGGSPHCQKTIALLGRSLHPHRLRRCRDLWVFLFFYEIRWLNRKKNLPRISCLRMLDSFRIVPRVCLRLLLNMICKYLDDI